MLFYCIFLDSLSTNISNQTVKYTYDKNGNLIKDLNKNISNIGYNCLNLPDEVTIANGNSIRYEYAADGTKLRTVHKTGAATLTTDYCSNAVYENGVLKMLLNEAGYVSFSDRKYHCYLKDHQGVRVVADKDGNVEETNAYYPFLYHWEMACILTLIRMVVSLRTKQSMRST